MITRITRIVLATLASATIVVTGSVAAQASDERDLGTVTFVTNANGFEQVLQATNELYPANASALNVVASTNRTFYQAQWHVVEAGPGLYRLINFVSGQALHATNEYTERGGTELVTTPAGWHSNAQLWHIRPEGTGVTIRNLETGGALTVTDDLYLGYDTVTRVEVGAPATVWQPFGDVTFSGEPDRATPEVVAEVSNWWHTPGEAVRTTVSVYGPVPPGTDFAWRLLGPLPAVNGSCMFVDWAKAQVWDSGTISVNGPGTHQVESIAVSEPGCYTFAGELPETVSTYGVVLAPGAPSATVFVI